jgi:hypothetical protein
MEVELSQPSRSGPRQQLWLVGTTAIFGASLLVRFSSVFLSGRVLIAPGDATFQAYPMYRMILDGLRRGELIRSLVDNYPLSRDTRER